MAQLLVRGVDDTTVNALKMRAKRHHRSLSAEARTILQEAAAGAGNWREEVERVRAMFEGRTFSDSSDLIREDRER
jgi:antitoxin FitA